LYSVYFIGAGPGAPQYLTLQGAAALSEAMFVYLLPPFAETFANLLQGKEVLSPFDYNYAELLELIDRQLLQEHVAFLIPGDLTFYSPYQGLIDHFAERSVVIAGVGVANAASARLKRTIDMPSVCSRSIIFSPKILAKNEPQLQIEQMAAPGVSLLIYMNNMPLAELVEKLSKGYGEDVPIALLHRLGLPGEQVVQGTLSTIVAACGGVDYFYLDEPEKKPALTLVIVGKSLQEQFDDCWWDCRREQVWKDQQK